jgi:hypothetical protein
MPRATKTPVRPDDAPLKRLGGGRWQTRDERFTIEPQSGTWVIVDAEQTDDFGMALVRGPFPSLTAAKDAIAGARSSGPATSPLADQIERRRGKPAGKAESKPRAKPTTSAASPRSSANESVAEKTSSGSIAAKARTRGRKTAPPSEEPHEPGWLTDLGPAERGRARRLIARLEEDGIPDAEGLVRRDVVGDVPAVAAAAIERRLAELGPHGAPDDVAGLLADGRDDRLDVRWRLVDGEGRPIVLGRGSRRRR